MTFATFLYIAGNIVLGSLMYAAATITIVMVGYFLLRSLTKRG